MTMRVWFVFMIGLALAGPVSAQSFMPMGSFEAVAYPVAITPIPLNTAGSGVGRSAPGAAAVQTTYLASPAVTQRVKSQFAEFVGRNGGDAAGLVAAMDREDFFARWGRHVASYGLRRGDVADAMTAYWMINWQIANEVTDVSRGQVAAVKRQVLTGMGADPSFRGLNDAQKQEMAEALILNFIIQSVAYEDAMRAGDTPMKGRLGDAAVARFRNEVGLDLRRVRLTEAGFSA
jgi:hypothetical protein